VEQVAVSMAAQATQAAACAGGAGGAGAGGAGGAATSRPFRSVAAVKMICVDKGKATNLPASLIESDGPLGLNRFVFDLHAVVDMCNSTLGECVTQPAVPALRSAHTLG